MASKRVVLFTHDQLKRLSNLLDNASQVLLATIILPILLTKGGKTDISMLLLGVVITISFWWAALRIERVSDEHRN